MSWAIGYDETWKRWIGYGVPAYCDHPDCSEEIDRGLGYVCGREPYGGEEGCGLYFCGKHSEGEHQLCVKCVFDEQPFPAKPEHPTWIKHLLTDESWQEWRDKNPNEVEALSK